ncbi:formate dehydrogenase subunit alpha [Azospirillum sp.]|uniref:formate dehydrogenase subunit alpha n=1 Tax=Azospirillum sp. TaxID=34012 RepID=UPI002D2E2B10|nr:formate dehydrogenase subunit alpha [Azospirillum sp.]HYD64624.1 formate dehydrogenase subunit alpha [Azospirillum sp.]
MSEGVTFHLDEVEVEARPGETIWQVATRLGTEIPHLCHSTAPDYRPDGNCRACMVEIDGERALAASCIRRPTPGMRVRTASDSAKAARRMVFELLVGDQPDRARAHDPDSKFWNWADRVGVTESRFPSRAAPVDKDFSHPAMAVQLDACIQCTLCVRACREVQVNDVIGMALRGHSEKIVFDFDDPMGSSTCVACGECVQACPTGALMPKTQVDAVTGVFTAAPDRKVDSVCPYCGVGCQLTYNIKDDALLSVTGRDGPANHGRLCVKGRFGFDYIHHKHRLTKPLIRRDGVSKHDADIDPANPLTHFREATWEEALALASGALKGIRDAHGGRALAGFGSAKGSNEEAYLFQKLVRTGFGSNNVDHCTRLCHASSVAALIEGIGSGAVTAPFNAAEDAEVIVVIGANPTENHPVAATFFKNAVERGAKLVVMDPRGQALKRFATHMLQFKPGRDVAMLNALLNVIITEGLYDRQYVEANTEDFDRLKAHIAGYTPEAMADVCGIPAATLRNVARLYARAQASIIFWGMGVSQHTHGTDNVRCLIALALTTGQVGRPGTGLHPLRGQNNVQGASDAGLIPMMYPDYRPVTNPEVRAFYEDFWKTELDPERGLTVVEVMDAIHAGQVRGMYIMGENPAMSDPDVQHAREALAKLDHLVVQDIFLTETAKYADVVLPASAWPEKDGTVTNTNRQVQLGRTALPMPGDARQDWWIVQELARGLGLDWAYTHPRDVFAEMKGAMPSLDNISWDRLEREGSVTYPSLSPEDPGQQIVFGDGFPTSSGRGRLVPAAVIPPAEEPDADFPMVLTTGRQLEHWHTGAMTRRAQVLDDLEPEAVAYMAPADLRRMGVEAGAPVRVTTRRGRIELKARSDSAVPSGLIFVPFCYAEAAANVLTNPQLDPFGKIPEFKFCAAKVEPAA